MTLSVDDAKALVIDFCATYPLAAKVRYKLRETQEELYGPQATREAVGGILGAFRPGIGQAEFPTSNFRDAQEFKGTLRHEILGHFGINTFNPAEKRAVLDGIIEARNEPGMADLWAEVAQLYPEADDSLKAEEVFAFACEAIEPQTRGNVIEGTRSFRETCIERSRPMQIRDLINVTTMVAEGMRDLSRSQQNFPATDYAQFKREEAMENLEDQAGQDLSPGVAAVLEANRANAADGLSMMDGWLAVKAEAASHGYVARLGPSTDNTRDESSMGDDVSKLEISYTGPLGRGSNIRTTLHSTGEIHTACGDLDVYETASEVGGETSAFKRAIQQDRIEPGVVDSLLSQHVNAANGQSALQSWDRIRNEALVQEFVAHISFATDSTPDVVGRPGHVVYEIQYFDRYGELAKTRTVMDDEGKLASVREAGDQVHQLRYPEDVTNGPIAVIRAQLVKDWSEFGRKRYQEQEQEQEQQASTSVGKFARAQSAQNTGETKKPFHEAIAEKLIEQLKQGTAPWQKPWQPGDGGGLMPFNPITGKRYKGINAIQLLSQGRDDQRWLTFKQAQAVDAQVRKGEKSTPIQYWKFEEEQTKRDENNKPVLDSKGNPVKVRVRLERPKMFMANVFNAEQIDGLPEYQKPVQTWNALDRAETILQASGADIRHGGDQAFYRPSTDKIQMPEKAQFPSAGNYYATALHELGHWTGHGSRLDRDLSHPFGSEGYAKEELRAEIASMILGDELGIGHDPDQHASYVQSWIKVLQNDPLEIIRAASDAEKIQTFVLGLEQQQIQTQQPVASQSQNEEQNSQGVNMQIPSPQPGYDGWIRDVAIRLVELGVPVDEVNEEVSDFPWFQERYEDGALASVTADEYFHLLMNVGLEESQPLTNESERAAGKQILMQQRPNIQAEEWSLKAIERVDLDQVVRRMTDDQLKVFSDVLGSMQELSNNNEFWTFREEAMEAMFDNVDTVADQIYSAMEIVADEQSRRLDVVKRDQVQEAPLKEPPSLPELSANEQMVATALRNVRSEPEPELKASFGRLLGVTSGQALSYELPGEWTGETQVVALVPSLDKEGVTVIEGDVLPEVYAVEAFYGLYAKDNAGDFVWMADYSTKAEAQAQADRLAAINSNAQVEQLVDLPAPVESNQLEAQARDGRSEVPATDRTYIQVPFKEKEQARELGAKWDRQERSWYIPKNVDQAAFGHWLAPALVGSDSKALDDKVQQPMTSESAASHVLRAVRQPDFEQEDAPELLTMAERELNRFVSEALGHQVMLPVRWTGKLETAGSDLVGGNGSEPVSIYAEDHDGAKVWIGVFESQTRAEEVVSKLELIHANARPLDQASPLEAATVPKASREYLAVPYGERAAAKAAGAAWDTTAKSWYVGPDGDTATLARWKPEKVSNEQLPAMDVREEFKQAMEAVGLIPGGKLDHPIMDGKKHRVPVIGGRKGATDGFYVAHVDGHPAGVLINNKTGIDMKWKSKGYSLTDEQKAALKAEAANKLQARDAEQLKTHERVAMKVVGNMEKLVPLVEHTPYMIAKGIEPLSGVLTDKSGKEMVIPAMDENGKVWTAQYIQKDGTKRFAKDGRKEGCFHVLGGMNGLAAAPAIVIGEGYATASTVQSTLGYATVSAFDSGNLLAVATALHAKFPEKPIVIVGDDDKHQVMTHGTNAGRTKAIDAAKAVGGKAIFPTFAPGEVAYPDTLPAITPQLYRKHLQAAGELKALISADGPSAADPKQSELKAAMLSDAQLAALEKMKRLTDFNDLATKSSLGREGLERQVKNAVEKVIGPREMKVQQPTQERTQGLDVNQQAKRAIGL